MFVTDSSDVPVCFSKGLCKLSQHPEKYFRTVKSALLIGIGVWYWCVVFVCGIGMWYWCVVLVCGIGVWYWYVVLVWHWCVVLVCGNGCYSEQVNGGLS